VLKDLTIQPKGGISQLSLKLGLNTFREVCDHLLHLPYRRPFGKTSKAVLDEGCGTCSSKHGVLKAIAVEQGLEEIELVLCLFRMTAKNTPAIKKVLAEGPLLRIPEAHTYIRWGDEKIDVTKPGLHILNMQSDVLKEQVISLEELSQKSEIHQEWMEQWLNINHPEVALTSAWQQREACITALGQT